MLNCKQGDLAIVIRSHAGNEGKIVTCVRLTTDVPHGMMWIEPGPRWEIDRYVMSKNGTLLNSFADNCLRPLPKLDEEQTFDVCLELRE